MDITAQHTRKSPFYVTMLVPILLLLMTTPVCLSKTNLRTRGFGVANVREKAMNKNYGTLSSEFLTKFYTQTLDHFNYRPESYTTFQQRYVVNFNYWGGPNTSSPIFVYTGDEAAITVAVSAAGFMLNLASRFNGLLLYIEHRYYGDSMPFGSAEEAFKNASTLGFFSTTQALADYAQLITDLKKNLSAESCAVIAIGGSYGGMLASWFRLKYPHVVVGALASSAPILYFDDITPQNAYGVIVTKDFRETSESCYDTIRQSWSEIDRVAAEKGGLQKLNTLFSSCRPFNSSQQLKDFLVLLYEATAQYDNPPRNFVSSICDTINGAPKGTDVLGKIAAAANANILLPCPLAFHYLYNQRYNGWIWQTCTEIIMPIGWGPNETMFQASPFDLIKLTYKCKDLFGATPRPHWITTEFGGHAIKSVLGNFASNIIFSNGLRDPYSAGGYSEDHLRNVLENISSTVVALYSDKGAHCLDILTPTPDDPDWLISQRDREIHFIEVWIAEHKMRKSSIYH